MKFSFTALICGVLIAVAFAEWDSDTLSSYEQERKILDTLLSTGDGGVYDPRIPPGERDAEPVEITGTMYIIDISNVNDFKNEFSMQFYFRQKWRDSRLAFDYLETGLPYLKVRDVEKVWRPDSFFVQEKVGRLHTIILPNIFLRITPDGEILYSVRLSVTFSCNMDLRYYPLDTQKCSFTIESYGSKTNEIIYKWGADANSVGASSELSVLGFSLTSLKPSSDFVQLTHGNYSQLQLELTLKRKVGFFMNKLYVPFVILVIASWLSFWIRAKFASLRLTLILTILFIMFWLESDVSRQTPPVSYTKAIDVWTGVCLSFVFASLLQFILVSHMGRNEKQRRKHQHQSSVDPEALFIKEEGSNLKYEKSSSLDSTEVNAVSRLIAGHLIEENVSHYKIDTFARILYPLSFILFNLIYWPVYCSGN